MSELKVAVVILNYNGKHHLKEFLPSVVVNTSSHAMYVVDNASTDDSIPFIKANFPQIKLIENKNNFGYAQGYNEALKQIDAKYYVLLNSDVEVSPDWITPLLELMEKNPQVAACQPKLRDLSKRDYFEYAGGSGGFIDFLGYPFCRGRLFESLEKDNTQYNTSIEVFWASGACFFVRADAFHLAGGFDGDYFAHMEEIDLCWRLKNLGYRIMIEPQSVVYHLGAGTLKKQSTNKTYLNFRNNISTLFKNEKSTNLIYKIPLRLFLDGVAGIKFLFNGQALHTLAILRGHFSFYAWIPSLIRKRQKNQSLPGFRHCKFGIYKGSIVFQRYVRGLKKFSELKSGFFSEH